MLSFGSSLRVEEELCIEERAQGGPVHPVVEAARRAGGGGGGRRVPLGAAGAAQLLLRWRRDSGGDIEGRSPRVAEGVAPGAGGRGRAPFAAGRGLRLPRVQA